MSIRHTLSMGSALLGLLAGCTNGHGLPENPGLQQSPLVSTFDQCSDLEKYVQDTATLQMRADLTAEKEGRYGYGIELAAGPMAASDAAGAATPRSGPSAFTTTNNQVAGVDESDFVKNDGTRIFLLSGQTLYVNRSWPADQLHTTAQVAIEGWPREMALDGDRVAVFSQVYVPRDGMVAEGGGAQPAMFCAPFMCGYWYGNETKITVIDVSDLSAPRVVSELYEPGGYQDSRRIDHALRVVLSDGFRWPAELRWWPEWTAQMNDNPAARAQAFDALMAANEKIIRATPLDTWLPRAYRKAADGTLVPQRHDCSEYHRTNAPTRLGLVSIATVDLAPAGQGADAAPTVTRTSILAEPGQIYASPTSLYVASAHWWWWDAPGQVDFTYLHRFSLTDPSRAVYLGSGGVAGSLLNQFSLDEQGDVLHVATTLHSRVYDPTNSWGRIETTNRVTALALEGGALRWKGDSGDLETGESITSARFVGDTAYVSTFRQIDPLLVLDLSNPKAISVVGKLEMPGFSTYLQPLDATHLLAIGEGTDGSSTGSGGVVSSGPRTLELSLFDVSDKAHPRKTFTQTVGASSAWSEALWDHKAFNYFPEKGLLAIPFVDWNAQLSSGDYWSSFVSELRVFSVSATSGFTPRGALTMRDVYQQAGAQDWVWYYTPNIRRSVMADDFVYAISDSGIRSANVADLAAPLATVTFNPYSGN